MRRVVSLWLPRFATDRWFRARRYPAAQCAGPAKAQQEPQPFALVHDEGGRLSLAAVNAVAEAAGLGVGLPLADARAFLPDLKTAPLEPEADARALARFLTAQAQGLRLIAKTKPKAEVIDDIVATALSVVK